MEEFSFSVPQNIVAGKGTIKKLPEVAAKLGGKKAFIISGPHLNKIGAVAACEALLAEAGIQAAALQSMRAHIRCRETLYR